MIEALLLLLQSAPAPAPAPPQQDIVVIGRQAEDTGKALAACAARRCPPKDDIAASLAHAEAQLVEGDYGASRRTLLAARRRNGRAARDLPIDVAKLHRANARLASFNGHRGAEFSGIFDTIDALKAGLPRDDERIMAARLELGPPMAREGRAAAAVRLYNDIAGKARERGMVTVEGLALFQKAALLSAMADANARFSPLARRATAAVAAGRHTEWAPFRAALALVPVVLASAKDRPRLLDAAVATIEPTPRGAPLLLSQPVFDATRMAFGASAGGDTEWADIRFRISARGTVEDLAVVRQSDHAERLWLDAVTASIAERRYAPLRLDAGDAGPLRTVRAAFISDRIFETGSRIVVRSPQRRVELLDLTGEEVAGR